MRVKWDGWIGSGGCFCFAFTGKTAGLVERGREGERVRYEGKETMGIVEKEELCMMK